MRGNASRAAGTSSLSQPSFQQPAANGFGQAAPSPFGSFGPQSGASGGSGQPPAPSPFQFGATANSSQSTPAFAPAAAPSTFNFGTTTSSSSNNPFQTNPQPQSSQSFGGFGSTPFFSQSTSPQRPSMSFDFGTTTNNFNAPQTNTFPPTQTPSNTQDTSSLFTFNTAASPGMGSLTSRRDSRSQGKGPLRNRAHAKKSKVSSFPGMPASWSQDPDWLDALGNPMREQQYAHLHGFTRVKSQRDLPNPPTVAQGALYQSEHESDDLKLQEAIEQEAIDQDEEIRWAESSPYEAHKKAKDDTQQPQLAPSSTSSSLFGKPAENAFGNATSGPSSSPFTNTNESTPTKIELQGSSTQNPFASLGTEARTSNNGVSPFKNPFNSNTTTAATGAPIQANSLFGTTLTPTTGTQLFDNNQASKPASNIFGNVQTPKPASSLFATSPTPNPSAGLFGGMQSNIAKPKEQDISVGAGVSKPIFTSSQSSIAPTNLFGASQSLATTSTESDPKAQASPVKSLFSVTAPSPNPFLGAQATQPFSTTAENQQASSTANLFAKPSTASSLFPRKDQNETQTTEAPQSESKSHFATPSKPQEPNAAVAGTNEPTTPFTSSQLNFNNSLFAKQPIAPEQEGAKQTSSEGSSFTLKQTSLFNPPSNIGKSLFDRTEPAGSQSSTEKPSFTTGSLFDRVEPAEPQSNTESQNTKPGPTHEHAEQSSSDASSSNSAKPLSDRVSRPEPQSENQKPNLYFGSSDMQFQHPATNGFQSSSSSLFGAPTVSEPKPQFPGSTTPVKPSTGFGSAQDSSKAPAFHLSPQKPQESLRTDARDESVVDSGIQDGLPPGYTKHWPALRSGEVSLERTVEILLHEWLRTINPPEAALKLATEEDRPELVWKWRHRQLQHEWKSHMDIYGSWDPNILETFRIIQALRVALDDFSGLKSHEGMLYVDKRYFDEISIKKSAKENMANWARQSASEESRNPLKRKNDEQEKEDSSPKKQRTSDVAYPSLPENSSKTSQMFANLASGASSPAKPSGIQSQPSSPAKPEFVTQASQTAESPQKSSSLFSGSSNSNKSNLFSNHNLKANSNIFSSAQDQDVVDPPPSGPVNPRSLGNGQTSFPGALPAMPIPNLFTNANQTSGGLFSSDAAQKPQHIGQEEQRSAPGFASSSGTDFMTQFGQAAKKTEEAEKAKRKAEDFDSDEENERQWERKDQEEQRAKRVRIEEAASYAKPFEFKPSGASTKQPLFSMPESGTSSGNDFLAQFGNAAQKTAESEKRKRMDEDYDSEEETKEQWEEKYEKERQAKKAKIQEASKSQDLHFKVQSSPAKPPLFSTPQFGAAPSHDFVAQFAQAAQKTAEGEKRKRLEEDYDSEEETKEQWEERYEKERQAKKAKIEESSKSEILQFKVKPTTTKAQNQKEATADAASPASAQTSSASSPLSQKKAEKSTSPAGDHTWKPDSPIKFAASSTAPSVSITAPSPIKPSRGLGESVFSTEKSDKPVARSSFDMKSSPFAASGGATSIFTQAASPKPPSPANLGGSIFAQASSPKPPSPANAVGSIFLQGGSEKPSRPSFDFTKDEPPSAPSLAKSDGWQDFLRGKNQPTGSPAASVFASLTPSRAVSPAVSAATQSGTETDNNEEGGGGGSGEGDGAPKDAQLDLKDTNAGEENEDQILSLKAKVQEYASASKSSEGTKTWQVRGVGELRVLRNKDSKKTRVVVRQEQSAKVLLNAGLLEGVEYGLASPKMVNFTVAAGNGGLSRWLIQVGKPESAKELSKLLEENKKN